MSESAALASRLALVVVTDPACGAGRGVVEVVRAALAGGAPAVQLRAKRESSREAYELAAALRRETRNAGALLFVNDRVDLALAADADGAHLGDDDLPLLAARRIVPPGFLLGRSVESADQARRAVAEGADYLGAGAVFSTPSKADTGPPIGLAGLAAIARAAGAAPVVAIGGVDESNAADVARSGAHGVAVIRAVMQAEDPAAAVARLMELVRR